MPVTVQAVGLSILLAATALTTIPEQSPLPDRCQVKQQLVGRSNAETDGPKVVIDTVDFDRPSQIPRAERDELVESLKHTQFSEAPGWLEQIEEVPVRGFWQDRGYFKAVVKAEAQPTGTDPEGQHFAVVLDVDEGLQYRLRGIRFRSSDCDDDPAQSRLQDPAPTRNKPTLRKRLRTSDDSPSIEACAEQPYFPDAELRAAIPISDGDIFDADTIKKGFDDLRRLYGSHGFIDFTAEPEFHVNDASQEISLTLVLDEQTQYVYRDVQILGLDSMAEQLLRANILPGKVVDNLGLENLFEENKNILPAGASIRDVELRRNVKAGTVDVTVDLRPCPQVRNSS